MRRRRGAREIRFPHSRRLEAATGQAAGQEAAAPETCDGGRRAIVYTMFDAGRAPSRPQICEKWTRIPFALATVDAAPAKRLARTFRSLTVMFRRRPKAAHASRTSESPRNVTTLTRRRARHASAAGPGKRRTAQSPRANAQPSAERPPVAGARVAARRERLLRRRRLDRRKRFRREGHRGHFHALVERKGLRAAAAAAGAAVLRRTQVHGVAAARIRIDLRRGDLVEPV